YKPTNVLEPELENAVKELVADKIDDILAIGEKISRKKAMGNLADSIIENLQEKFPESESSILEIISNIERDKMREMILEKNIRIDNRGPKDIRNIKIEPGFLKRTHGSALFTRGETQALAALTLGTKMDEQKIEDLEGESFKSFILHYNFPPYSVGEVRRATGPGRREIGHGALAERALRPVVPNEDMFPYTIRIVSDILESNGSSSMASVCAGSLCMMDAGVPTKSAVAGIAMGLVMENGKHKILSDILGDEDHMGDMDFKVAGTAEGITAFQMDVKITGVSLDILREALEQAKQGREYILGKMNEALAEPRDQLSPYAPRIISIKIDPEKIGAIIGTGGKTVRSIQDATNTTISIEDDGTVQIASVSAEGLETALKMIEELTTEAEIGQVYEGKVVRITEFGAFVQILPNQDGLLHISELEHSRTNDVRDVLKIGDMVKVKVIDISEDGKVRLSRKALLPKPEGADDRKPRDSRYRRDNGRSSSRNRR
ncbi:polyribonucleotide nucleotidyltransferase, partial [bacterium]